MTTAPTFLAHPPVPLAFGTSGLRGLVKDITDLEAYINTAGFVAAMMERGELEPHGTVTIAGDLRPSTPRIMTAVGRALVDAGLSVENAGHIPTPALTLRGLAHGRPSIMVTGSHIPFDRNGIKFNKSKGEILKTDEADILRSVARVRRAEYARSAAESHFDADGMLKPVFQIELPAIDRGAELDYRARYTSAFGPDALRGLRLLVFQHSAVGRDLLVAILEDLGATALPAGRSETFVPIDTENVTDSQLDRLDALVAAAEPEYGRFDAIVSTDGDSDRPLLAAVALRPHAGRRVRFFPGDLVGIVVAEQLAADCAVVPISANDAIDLKLAQSQVRLTKTRIGSPYVIAAMEEQRRAGGSSRIVGWEANGGFLLGSDFALPEGGRLAALPTRDAVLPLVAALLSARARGLSLVERFAELPARFGKAGLLDEIPAEISGPILEHFSLPPGMVEVDFRSGDAAPEVLARKRELEELFDPALATGPIARLNTLDGLRIYFANGDIAHLRPSGNAPQLRLYATSATQERADRIVAESLAEPNGIVRRLAARAELKELGTPRRL